MEGTDFDLREEETKALTLLVSVPDHVLLERYAAYRNGLARVEGKKLRVQHSRKSIAERMLEVQCGHLRSQLEGMVLKIGQLPDADDVAAVDQYCSRAIEYAAEEAQRAQKTRAEKEKSQK